MTDGLPDEIWSLLFRPPPAWPWSIEPDFDPNGHTEPLLDLDFPGAAKAGFAFLGGLGFVLTAADAWDISDDAITVAWERVDAVLLATLARDGSFFVVIAPRAVDEDHTSTRARLAALASAADEVAVFGSLPLLADDPATIATTVARYASVLQERIVAPLTQRPFDPGRLQAPAEAAVDDIRRPRSIAHVRERAEAAWQGQRYEAFLKATERLERLGVPLDDPGRVAIAEARRGPPMTLGDGDLDEATRIRRAVELVQDKQRGLDEAIEHRDEGRAAWARWEDAAREWHEAMDLLYPKSFWDRLQRMRAGDSATIDAALTFLEVDPWCFRSGYAKETILRLLKRATLTAEQAEKIRSVILRTVDIGDRREFRASCKLAPHVVDDSLRAALLERLRFGDPGRARRALWVLDALREPFGPDDRATIQAILERAAIDEQWWRVATWVEPYAARYNDPAWSDRLLTRALGPAPERTPALRLLSAAHPDPSDPQRRGLAALVLAEIERADDGYWLEGTAVLADHPAFREDLIAAYEGASEPDVRRRAWWAINAIRRHAQDGWPGDRLGI